MTSLRLLSSVLSKAGLFMLFGIAVLFTVPVYGVNLTELLGWIGVLTAIGGAFFALFQEDIKYTLAYSSMSQMGYMLLAFSLMSQLGWVDSIYLAVTHLLFKGMIFIAIAGVIPQDEDPIDVPDGRTHLADAAEFHNCAHCHHRHFRRSSTDRIWS